MEGCRKGGHSHTNPLTQGSGAPLLCTREHTVWGGGHPSTEPGRPVGRARALLLIFFHLVLATSFLVPARRHTEDHYCKVLQETLQQTDLRTLGELRQPSSQSPPGAQEQTDLRCVYGGAGVNITDPKSRGAS